MTDIGSYVWPAVAGILVAAGLLFGGHYAFQPPRTAMRPPYTYVYGVASCLGGVALWCLLTNSWAVPFLYILAVFVCGGALVWALYRIDRDSETRHHLADLVEDRRRLQAAADERLRNIGGG